MNGRILLIADDYALNVGVSQAIRMLAAARRVTGTSALVNAAAWRADAAALRELTGSVAVGLHLNFTHGAPLSTTGAFARSGKFPSRAALMATALTGRLDRAMVEDEIVRQCDAFEAGLGMPPDFVDGHEHMHVLPTVRSALLATLARRYPARPILIRDPGAGAGVGIGARARSSKSFALRALSRQFSSDCQRAGFICNDVFGGVSQFSATRIAVDAEFENAAGIVGWRPLVMCHPGFTNPASPGDDPLAKRRQLEFDSLMAPSSPLAANVWRAVRNASGSIDWPRAAPERPA